MPVVRVSVPVVVPGFKAAPLLRLTAPTPIKLPVPFTVTAPKELIMPVPLELITLPVFMVRLATVSLIPFVSSTPPLCTVAATFPLNVSGLHERVELVGRERHTFFTIRREKANGFCGIGGNDRLAPGHIERNLQSFDGCINTGCGLAGCRFFIAEALNVFGRDVTQVNLRPRPQRIQEVRDDPLVTPWHAIHSRKLDAPVVSRLF